MKTRKIIQVPYFKQKRIHTCGPASMKMVFRFFGLHTKESELAKMMKTEKEGTKYKALIGIARKKGFYCYVHEKASLNQVRHFIDIGLPVIVNYTEPDTEEGHYAVVVGYDKDRVVIHDPWNGQRFRLKFREFERRWADKNHWVLVLSKREFNIGKQYGPGFITRLRNK